MIEEHALLAMGELIDLELAKQHLAYSGEAKELPHFPGRSLPQCGQVIPGGMLVED